MPYCLAVTLSLLYCHCCSAILWDTALHTLSSSVLLLYSVRVCSDPQDKKLVNTSQCVVWNACCVHWRDVFWSCCVLFNVYPVIANGYCYPSKGPFIAYMSVLWKSSMNLLSKKRGFLWKLSGLLAGCRFLLECRKHKYTVMDSWSHLNVVPFTYNVQNTVHVLGSMESNRQIQMYK